MQIFLTIIAGVFIFILSQYLLKFILEPILELKKSLSEIMFSLDYYSPRIDPIANYHTGTLRNDIPESKQLRIQEVEEELARLSAVIISKLNSTLFYDLVHRIFYLPHRERIIEIAKILKNISNWTDIEERKSKVSDAINEVKKIINQA